MADTGKSSNDPHTAADAGGDSAKDRQNCLQQLFIQCYGELQASAYDAYPNLMVLDCDRILTTAAGELKDYNGPCTREGFFTWASKLVTTQAKRYELTTAILRDQHRVIRAAIRRNMRSSAEDCATSAEDLHAEIALLIWKMTDQLCTPSRAKLSTRVTALCRRHIQSYHLHKRANRLRIIQSDPDRLYESGCETLDPTELAAERAEAMAES